MNDKEIRKEIEDWYQGQDIVKEVERVVARLSEKSMEEWQPDELSRAAARLAILLVNLGQLVSKAELSANVSYIYRKWKQAEHISRLSKNVSVTFAKETVDSHIVEELESQLKNRYKADKLKTLYDDCERLVSVMQTRLGILRNEEVRLRS